MINLLPPQQKEELSQERRYKLLLISGISVIFFLAVLSSLFFPINIFISGRSQESKFIISPELQTSEKEIAEINESLESLHSFYNNQPHFAEFLEKIYRMLPSGVYLTSLTFSFSEKEEIFSISLRGFSPTRENLLQLKRNLKSEQNLRDVDFPISNLLKPDDIDFNINFKVKI